MANELKLPILNQPCCAKPQPSPEPSLSYCSKPEASPGPTPSAISPRTWLIAAVASVSWLLLYSYLEPAAVWITYSLLQLKRGEHLGSAVEFFVFDAPKVLMLMTLAVFGIGIIRSFITPERTRAMLAGKRESVGNVLGALIGIVTPFCSCSAVPLFIAFVTTGIPLGVTLSYLISAPMVNEVALVLLFAMFGWRVAAIYAGTGVLIAIVAGWTIGRLKMERYVEPWVYATQFGEAAAGDTRVVLPSPQASIMKALVEGFMSRQPVTYILFGAGAATAVIMEMLGVPALLFALGMYLPLELNTPALVGGVLAHFHGRRTEKLGGARGNIIRERGVIIASGLMAGGALGGVFGAACRLMPHFSEAWISTPFYGNEMISQSVSALLFVGLCAYLWWRSVRHKEETEP